MIRSTALPQRPQAEACADGPSHLRVHLLDLRRCVGDDGLRPPSARPRQLRQLRLLLAELIDRLSRRADVGLALASLERGDLACRLARRVEDFLRLRANRVGKLADQARDLAALLRLAP